MNLFIKTDQEATLAKKKGSQQRLLETHAYRPGAISLSVQSMFYSSMPFSNKTTHNNRC